MENIQTFSSVKRSASYTYIDENGKVVTEKTAEVVKKNDVVEKADYSESVKEWDKDGRVVRDEKTNKQLKDVISTTARKQLK